MYICVYKNIYLCVNMYIYLNTSMFVSNCCVNFKTNNSGRVICVY